VWVSDDEFRQIEIFSVPLEGFLKTIRFLLHLLILQMSDKSYTMSLQQQIKRNMSVGKLVYLVHYLTHKARVYQQRLYVIEDPLDQTPSTVHAYPEYYVWKPNTKSPILTKLYDDLTESLNDEMYKLLEMIKNYLIPQCSEEDDYGPNVPMPSDEQRKEAEEHLKGLYGNMTNKDDFGDWAFLSYADRHLLQDTAYVTTFVTRPADDDD